METDGHCYHFSYPVGGRRGFTGKLVCTVVSVPPVKLWLKFWHPKFNKFFFPQCHLVQILDGTLVANACVEFRFKERLPCFVCMLDMEKHLVCLIEGFSYMFWMGFGASLCGWIRNVCNLQLSQC